MNWKAMHRMHSDLTEEHIFTKFGNHSTQDLEIENLSAKALLLIYSDFRVKSHMENGKEIINFYTLEEAFNVILNKLDNVKYTIGY